MTFLKKNIKTPAITNLSFGVLPMLQCHIKLPLLLCSFYPMNKFILLWIWMLVLLLSVPWCHPRFFFINNASSTSDISTEVLLIFCRYSIGYNLKNMFMGNIIACWDTTVKTLAPKTSI